ncbi:MAG: ribbon-helix-helix domain-containing protein [Nitrospiria bacterium]
MVSNNIIIMETMSFSVNKETKKQIEKIAKEEGISKSDLFREVFAMYQFNKALDYFQKLAKNRILKLGLETEEDFEKYLA